jgi:hypothetical protein
MAAAISECMHLRTDADGHHGHLAQEDPDRVPVAEVGGRDQVVPARFDEVGDWLSMVSAAS